MQIELTMDDQVQANWCWAAVTAAALNHFSGSTARPCDIAAAFLGDETCCDHPEGFDQLQRLRDVLPRFGLLREPETNAIPDAVLKNELLNGRPVAARIVFGDDRVHFVLIVGLLDDGHKIVLDPDGPVQRTLSDVDMRFRFPANDGIHDGSWSNTYLLQAP